MIDDELFGRYARAIDANADLLKAAVLSLESSLSGVPDAQLPQAMGALYASLVAEYGGYAAAIACDFYESQREISGVSGSYEPAMADPADRALLYHDAREASSSSAGLQSALGKLQCKAVQRAMEQADATVIGNASRDPAHPLFALVPHAGACGFCVMLASNGFVYHSKARANASRHPSCRCRPVADFDTGNPSLAGYDPDAMRAAYRNAKKKVEEDARAKWEAMDAEERGRWAVKGKGAYDHYLRNRVAAEMGTRDRGWLMTGKPCEISKEAGAKPWAKEKAIASMLAAKGFSVRFVKEAADKKTFDAYLNGVPYEFKVPESYNGKTVKNQFKKAVGKGTRNLVIGNVVNRAPMRETSEKVRELFDGGEFGEISDVLLVGEDGQIVRLKR